MPEVRRERTHWRDEALSLRHREWGFDCPAVDVDFLAIEYDQHVAKMLVEYKHEAARRIPRYHPSIRAIIDLANRAGVPALMVRYAADFSWWRPVLLNTQALSICGSDQCLSEAEWVELLYRCRGREMSPALRDALKKRR